MAERSIRSKTSLFLMASEQVALSNHSFCKKPLEVRFLKYVDISLEFEKILTSLTKLMDESTVSNNEKDLKRLSKLYDVVQDIYLNYHDDQRVFDEGAYDDYNDELNF